MLLCGVTTRRQGRQPTCPMCNARIQLEVLYRLPLPWRPALDSAEPQVTLTLLYCSALCCIEHYP